MSAVLFALPIGIMLGIVALFVICATQVSGRISQMEYEQELHDIMQSSEE